MGYTLQQCVRGSLAPGKFITDMRYGESVDILFVGDSNCHYGEPAFPQGSLQSGVRVFGLADAFGSALMSLGYYLYASPLYPIMVGSNVFKSGLGTSLNTGYDRVADTNVLPSGAIKLGDPQNSATTRGYLGTVYNVSNAAFSSLPDNFSYFHSEMSGSSLRTVAGSNRNGFFSHDPSVVPSNPAPVSTDWMLLTVSNTPSTFYRFDYLRLDSPFWISQSRWDNSTIYFRLTHSSSPNGGSCNISILKAIGETNTIDGSANLTLASKDIGETGFKFKDSEIPINIYPMTGGTGPGGRPLANELNIETGVSICFAGTYATVVPPIGLFFASIYEKKPGFSINLLQCEGQSLPEDHINKFKTIANNGNYLKQYLKAIVRRQQAANPKAKGRVLVVFQAGTNTNVSQGGFAASTNSKDATTRVHNSFKESIALLNKEWKDCGFNPSNINYIVVGGPVTSNSFSDAISSDLLNRLDYGSTTVIDHVKALPRSEYISNSYWDVGNNNTGAGSSTPSTHLTESGYIEWAGSIINNLIKNFKVRLTRK